MKQRILCIILILLINIINNIYSQEDNYYIKINNNSQINVRVSRNYSNQYTIGEINTISYYIHGEVSFSELDKYLKNDKNINFDNRYFEFSGGKFVIDLKPQWMDGVKTIIFLRCEVEFSENIFPDVSELLYNVKNYDKNFYKYFPNVETLSISVDSIYDIRFLSTLKNLKNIEIETKNPDKSVLTKIFEQYYEYITKEKTLIEGYVNIISPYHYPNYDPDEDVYKYYAEIPEWYKGVDISGIPAWLNDDRVRLRKSPTTSSEIIKVLNKGDYVLIKGRGYPVNEYDVDRPWSTEEEYREEMYYIKNGIDYIDFPKWKNVKEEFEKTKGWIKVRLVDRTEGYIYGEYLTLKNPKYYLYKVKEEEINER